MVVNSNITHQLVIAPKIEPADICLVRSAIMTRTASPQAAASGAIQNIVPK